MERALLESCQDNYQYGFFSPSVDVFIRFGGIIFQTNKLRMIGTGCLPSACGIIAA
jgi:hypothetical protein